MENEKKQASLAENFFTEILCSEKCSEFFFEPIPSMQTIIKLITDCFEKKITEEETKEKVNHLLEKINLNFTGCLATDKEYFQISEKLYFDSKDTIKDFMNEIKKQLNHLNVDSEKEVKAIMLKIPFIKAKFCVYFIRKNPLFLRKTSPELEKAVEEDLRNQSLEDNQSDMLLFLFIAYKSGNKEIEKLLKKIFS